MAMNAVILMKGVIIGLIMASPFGPVGLIFIQRSLQNERYEGIASGLGIATGDMFYSIVTVFGITVLYDFINVYLFFIKIIAFGVLCYMAIRTLSVRAEFKILENHQRSLVKSFFLSFGLALHNPSSIVVFAFLFALFDIGEVLTCANGVLLITGIFSGSLILWFTTNNIVHFIRETGKLNYLSMIYRLSGVTLLILSGLLLFSLIRPGIL